MKNLLIITVFTVGIFGLTSCGGDDCTQDDWVGTWELQGDGICDLGGGATVEADKTIVFTAGAADNQIASLGETFTINSINCTISVVGETLTLNGNTLSQVLDASCDPAEYKKK